MTDEFRAYIKHKLTKNQYTFLDLLFCNAYQYVLTTSRTEECPLRYFSRGGAMQQNGLLRRLKVSVRVSYSILYLRCLHL